MTINFFLIRSLKTNFRDKNDPRKGLMKKNRKSWWILSFDKVVQSINITPEIIGHCFCKKP